MCQEAAQRLNTLKHETQAQNSSTKLKRRTQAQNSSIKFKHKVQAQNSSTNGGDASRVGIFSAALSRLGESYCAALFTAGRVPLPGGACVILQRVSYNCAKGADHSLWSAPFALDRVFSVSRVYCSAGVKVSSPFSSGPTPSMA